MKHIHLLHRQTRFAWRSLASKFAALLLAAAVPACTARLETVPPPPVPKYLPNPAGVAQFIKDARPGIDPKEATRIAKLIVSACAKYRVDPLTLASIVAHESQFEREVLACTPRGCDYGLGQINEVHIDEMKLDPDRLLFDDAYNLNVAARILSREKEHQTTEKNWYSRYHDARTPQRTKYEEKVTPFFAMAHATR